MIFGRFSVELFVNNRNPDIYLCFYIPSETGVLHPDVVAYIENIVRAGLIKDGVLFEDI